MFDGALTRVARVRNPRISQDAFKRPLELGLAIVALMSMQRMLPELQVDQPPLVLAGLVVLLLTQLLVAVECVFPRRLGWVLVVACIVGIGLVVTGQLAQPEPTNALWRTDAWFAVPFAYLAVIEPRARQVLTLAAATLAGFLVLAVVLPMDWRAQLLSMLFTAAPIALLAIARLAVVAIVDECLTSQRERDEQSLADEVATTRSRAIASLRRDMHDTLLHCLQLVGAPWSSATVAEVRTACRRAADRLGVAPGSESAKPRDSLVQHLRDAIGQEPCRVRWDVRAVEVPPVAADAISRAAREAVRNVVKHCAVASADIRVRPTAHAIRVDIRDSGPGFDPAKTRPDRRGVAHTMVAGMLSVGGTATIRSRPSGTTVTLLWPATPPPAPQAMGQRARSILSLGPVPLVTASLANILLVHTGIGLWPSVLIWLAMVAVIVLASLRLRQRDLTTRQAWVLCAVAVAGMVANFCWVDPGLTNSWEFWMPSLTGSLVMLALPGRSVATALAMAGFVLSTTIVSSLLRLGQHATFVTHFGSIMGVIVPTAVTLVLAFGAAGVSRYLHRTRQLEVELHRHALAAAERDRTWQAWLARAQDLTGDFLHEVATGRRPADSAETRQEALWREARVRDELRLWPGDGAVAERLDQLRRAGWECQLDLDGPGDDLREQILAALSRVDAALPGQKLRITQHGDKPILTFEPALAADLLPTSGVDWDIVDDPDFTQLRAPLRLAKAL